MIQKLIELYKKYKEVVNYLIFGVLTTVINIVSFYLLSRALPETSFITLNTAIAWVISVIFAYITNKVWVFESRDMRPAFLLKEMASFFGARLLSGGVDLLIMFIFAQQMGYEQNLVKILSNILVIILNYIFSKLFVFRKKKEM